jgi:hypothetical protein
VTHFDGGRIDLRGPGEHGEHLAGDLERRAGHRLAGKIGNRFGAGLLQRVIGERRLVVLQVHHLHARLSRVVAVVLDERRHVAQAHVVGAGVDALDGGGGAGAGVHLHVEAFLLEVAALQPQPGERGLALEAPVEREFDLGLRLRRARERQQNRENCELRFHIIPLCDADGAKP